MLNELFRSPAWFCATLGLIFVCYGLIRTIYEMVNKRWSLVTIARRLTRLERKVDRVAVPPKTIIQRGKLRLVHSVPGKTKRQKKPPPGSGPNSAA